MYFIGSQERPATREKEGYSKEKRDRDKEKSLNDLKKIKDKKARSAAAIRLQVVVILVVEGQRHAGSIVQLLLVLGEQGLVDLGGGGSQSRGSNELLLDVRRSQRWMEI